MYMCGMSSEDIEEQIQEIYEVDLDQTTVSKITNTMLENIKEWKSRLLKQEYYILWTDGISIRIRHYGQVINKKIYLVIGLNKDAMS